MCANKLINILYTAKNKVDQIDVINITLYHHYSSSLTLNKDSAPRLYLPVFRSTMKQFSINPY